MPTYDVEFVGGPFDGHRQRVSIPPDQLLPRPWLPVSPDVFCLIEGKMPARASRVTSMAIYEQVASQDAIRYRFVGSKAPSKVFGQA